MKKRLLLIPILGLLLLYCIASEPKKNDDSIEKVGTVQNYSLIVERGAFHYDKFVLTDSSIQYLPDTTSLHSQEKYNVANKMILDSSIAEDFFKEIITKGFWKLNDYYPSESSCSSKLIVTFQNDEKSKTVICEDYSKGCPNLMKYIGEKMVKIEGNDLKRIYLPG